MKDNLWNEIETLSGYNGKNDLYQNHLLEQYKIYVEMADRISSRRNLANVFFSTLNTAILTIIGGTLNKSPIPESKLLPYISFIGLSLLCVVWWWLLRSYRNLNSAKYKVIGQIEKELPISPYWSAEWKELGEGKDLKKYLPLTHLEGIVPIVFLLIYLVTIVYVCRLFS